MAQRMYDIFDEIQDTHHSHDRLCIELKSIFDNSKFSHFADDFFEFCRFSLVSSERSVYRERTIDFIVKFVLYCGKATTSDAQTSHSETLANRMLHKTFLFLVKYNDCSNAAVRFRCTQIMHKLLDGVGENALIPNELFDIIRRTLLRRIQDIKSSVRAQSVQALSRMQDPTDLKCPAVEAFSWLARHDPTAEVRRAALSAMVLTTRTLPCLVERTRDVADSVRKTAFNILAPPVVLRSLSIANRLRVVQTGLNDRSPEVRQAACALTLSWFGSSDKDPVQFLRRFDCEGEPKTSQLILDTLFIQLSKADLQVIFTKFAQNFLTSDRLLKSEHLTPEPAFFWRAAIAYLVKATTSSPANNQSTDAMQTTSAPDNEGTEGDSELLPFDRLLELFQPSVVAYSELAKTLVSQFVDMLDKQFDETALEKECVVGQVLEIASLLDLSDEFGRRQLLTLTHDWITSPKVPGSLAGHLLTLHGLLVPDLRKRINNAIELISELCDPSEDDIVVPSPQAQAPNQTGDPAVDGGADLSTTEPAPVDSAIATPAAQQPPKLDKAVEHKLRMQIARFDVQLNEVNESLYNCVQRMEFVKATGLRDARSQLERQRDELVQQLHGNPQPQTNSSARSAETPSAAHSPLPLSTAVVDDAPTDDGEQAHEGDDDDVEGTQHQRNRLSNLSIRVLVKANRLASLLVEQSPSLSKLPSSLRSLLDSLILPCIQHNDPSVRNHAMHSLGLCCTMDLQLSIQYLPLFYSAMRVDHATISKTALNCLIDCFLLFGFRPFHQAGLRPGSNLPGTDEASILDPEEEDEGLVDLAAKLRVGVLTFGGSAGRFVIPSSNQSQLELVKSTARFIKPIIELLDNENEDELLCSAALGLAKLLLHDRIVSSSLLSRLLLLWFNPLTEERSTLRLQLACFFADYACGRSGAGQSHHQASLAEAVLPTLSSVLRAPASSPLSEIESGDVASLLVRLTDSTYLPSSTTTQPTPAPPAADENEGGADSDQENDDGNDGNTDTNTAWSFNRCNPHHDRLAIELCAEVLNAPQSAEARLYLRLLCQLSPSTFNLEVFKRLCLMLDSIQKHVDRTNQLIFHKLRKHVTDHLQKHFQLTPKQVLEAEQDDKQSTTNSSLANSPASNRSKTPSPSTADDQQAPTLLASARVNLHVNQDDDSVECRSGDNRPKAGQTLLARSMLDKSQHPHTLLNFDDDDDIDSTSSSGEEGKENLNTTLVAANNEEEEVRQRRKSADKEQLSTTESSLANLTLTTSSKPPNKDTIKTPNHHDNTPSNRDHGNNNSVSNRSSTRRSNVRVVATTASKQKTPVATRRQPSTRSSTSASSQSQSTDEGTSTPSNRRSSQRLRRVR